MQSRELGPVPLDKSGYKGIAATNIVDAYRPPKRTIQGDRQSFEPLRQQQLQIHPPLVGFGSDTMPGQPDSLPPLEVGKQR